MKVPVFQILLSVDHVENVLSYSTMHHTMQADSHCLCFSDLPQELQYLCTVIGQYKLCSLA